MTDSFAALRRVAARHGRLLVWAAGLAACGSGPTSGEAAASHVTVIDTTALRCSEFFRPGDSLPPRVHAAAVGPRGLFAWQPAGKSMLVIRSPDGGEVRIDGQAGDSRFIRARQMGWNGDTLWLTDAESNRIQRFTPDGHSLGALLAPDLASWVLLPDGRLRAAAPRGFSFAGVPDSSFALIGAVAGGEHVDTLVAIATPPWKEVLLPGGPQLNWLSVNSLAGISGDGSRWCVTASGAEGTRLRCYDAEGQSKIDRLIGESRRPVTDTIYNAVVRGLGPTMPKNPDSLQALMPRADSLPFAFNLRFGHDGSFWLLRSHWSEPEQVWLRLTADGMPRDELHLPLRYFVLAFSGDSLWVAERDEAQLQRVNRCEVTR